jgi:hypothetical protein
LLKSMTVWTGVVMMNVLAAKGEATKRAGTDAITATTGSHPAVPGITERRRTA